MRWYILKLAISGKGGVGKTTIAAILIYLFSTTCKTVYAIDGDPDACLANALGIDAKKASLIKPVVEMRDKIREITGEGALYKLNPSLKGKLDEYCYHLGNINFMRMGNVKKGGSECYCRENTFLSVLMSCLLLDQDEMVVMDMGAGIEHLSRGTARGVDMMLVVVEPSVNSVNTARNVKEMAKDLGIDKVKIIANKIRKKEEENFIRDNFLEENILGFLPFDDKVWENSMDFSQNLTSYRGKLFTNLEEIKKGILSK